MSFLKFIGTACVLGSSVLMGCATHSADLTESPALALQSHHWSLQKALTSQGAEDGQWFLPAMNGHPEYRVALDFSRDQRVNVGRLCNNMSGSYELSGSNIQIARMMASMMACNDAALMKLERSVAQQLPQAVTWQILNPAQPTLELTFDGGAVWLLKGVPTYEALYGPSQQVFLEVGPKKVACSQPLTPDAVCLQVRDVTYNAQGIKQSTGDWVNYYGAIEGYKHQDGVRNILRLKRFTRDKVSADSSRYVDVLDLVVESEVVQ